MKKINVLKTLIFVVVLICIALWLILKPPSVDVGNPGQVPQPPEIKPDYTDIAIPPNIAPMNFAILEKGNCFLAKIYSVNGEQISVASRNGKIKIPKKSWRKLLSANKGNILSFDIFVRSDDNAWRKFQTINNTIAADPIDGVLVYRFMKPIHNWWSDIGIY